MDQPAIRIGLIRLAGGCEGTGMKRLLAHRPTPALVVALVALFVSLGGVSYGAARSTAPTSSSTGSAATP
jgi:hypothetical protein